MARPVVGIYATAAPVSWGPWRDRPSALAPSALGEALRDAGAMVVLLAPDPDLERTELLRLLDGLVVFDDAPEIGALVAAARVAGVAVRVLDRARVTAAASVAEFAAATDGLLAARS